MIISNLKWKKNRSMFDKDFYPTKEETLDKMGIDCVGKYCLEPSAGKGNIIDYLYKYGAKKVDCYESNHDLAKIVSNKGNLIGYDFFESNKEDISHIDLIVMNPPFSNQSKHIQHAFNIAPEGCEIISLCNSNIEYGNKSIDRSVVSLYSQYGSYTSLGQEFTNAERQTGVEVGIVKLYKPIHSKGFDFDGFLVEEEEISQEYGVLGYDKVRALVNSYVATVKKWDDLENCLDSMNIYSKLFKPNYSDFTLAVGYNNQITSKQQFSILMQKYAWEKVFEIMNIQKYVTSGVMSNVKKFVETQSNVPFTMRNVYNMVELIFNNKENTFNQSLKEAVENFTKHTHKNRFHVEGWKTNSGYMLNKKFIIPYMVHPGYRVDQLDLNIGSYHTTQIDDLLKVICWITGNSYDKVGSINQLFPISRGEWIDWGFFRLKGYKKGTIHFEFKEDEVWYLLNKKYGELYGFVLPEKMNNNQV